VSPLLWLVAGLAVLTVMALAVTRPSGAVSAPRLAAAVELLALAAIGLMPPLLVACAAAAWGTAADSAGRMVAGVCVLASGPAGPAQLALYGFALALLARTGFLAARAVAAAHRAELRGLALDGATPRQLDGRTTAWVLPSVRLAAYSGGPWHPRAVVTTGLLGLLSPAEQGRTGSSPCQRQHARDFGR
jgi:Zn-dependent protease with chaperone function